MSKPQSSEYLEQRMDTNESSHYAIAPMQEPKFLRSDDGTAVLEGLHIFRAGEFRDSLGRDKKYEDSDMASLASNFNRLRESGVFPNVPVRTDHSRSVQNVVGYLKRVYAKGRDLFADVEITEPDAADKWERKTYRSRSIEVGRYRTNSGDTVSPTVLGLAFVDVPAVEGLFQRHDNQETDVTFSQEQLDWAVAAAYAQGIEDDTPSQEQIDYAVACGYAQADDDLRAQFEKNSDRPPYQFRIGEDLTYEYAAVQKTLDMLYQFRQETVEANRTSFVDELVTENKIAAPQADKLKAFAKGLSDQQFADFRSTFNDAPKLSLLGDHTSDDSEKGGDGESAFAAEIAIARDVVDMHRRSGMSEEQLQATESYQRLLELEGNKE